MQILSISLQLSGAIILLLWCLKGASKEQVVRKYFPGSNIIKRDDEGNCRLSKEKLQVITSEVYINALAFIDLILGYLITYFVKGTYSPCCAVVLTVILTIVLIVFEKFVAKKLAAKKYSQDLVIPYSYLEKYGVDTSITDKEIEDMFTEVFDRPE